VNLVDVVRADLCPFFVDATILKWNHGVDIVPQDEGFETRQLLYNAYHQLNHYNLFGGGYLSSARSE
jgi:fructosamine-3-kinase